MPVIAVLLLLFAPIIGYSQTKKEKQVLQLSAAKFRWMTARHFDSLASMLDGRLQYVHSNGWIQNRAEFFGDFQSGKLTYQSIEVKAATARVYPRMAVVTGYGIFSVTMSGTSATFDLSYTEVYVRRGRSWWLVSRHANRNL